MGRPQKYLDELIQRDMVAWDDNEAVAFQPVAGLPRGGHAQHPLRASAEPQPARFRRSNIRMSPVNAHWARR
jgi:hypothetical protein